MRKKPHEMSRFSTAHLCAHCKTYDREPDVAYCRPCMDAQIARLLDELQPTQGCDLKCKTQGLEVLSKRHFRCCKGEV